MQSFLKSFCCMSLVVGSLLPAALANANDDPFESLNRDILKFNDAADEAFLRPIAVAYDSAVPRPIRQGFVNAYENLSDVNAALNALLQGRPVAARISAERLLKKLYRDVTTGTRLSPEAIHLQLQHADL